MIANSKVTLAKSDRSVTIVVYHYIRDTHKTLFHNIKALPVESFKVQIDFFQKEYTIMGLDECIHALHTDNHLPKNSLVLTFDDGLIDHFTTVLPLLRQRRLQACFFPSAHPIKENVVLDVHKIHFILASVTNVGELIRQVFHTVDEYRSHYSLLARREYYARYALPGMFDNSEVMLFKSLLQRALPEVVRHKIVQDLFTKYVTKDEKSFANDLYLNKEQLRTMAEYGMYIGVHGYTHAWMNELAAQQQREEIDRSLAFLSDIGVKTINWSISYPYGAYNDSLLTILKESGCALGLTTKKGVAKLSYEAALTLPRLDTDHLPQS